MPTKPVEPNPELSQRLARLAPVLLLAYALGQFALFSATVDSKALAISLSIVSWLGFTGLLLLTTASLTAIRMPWWGVLLTGAASTAIWAGLAYGLGDDPPRWTGILASCAMIVAMAALGRILSWLFRDANLLPPAMLVAGVVDLWGVNFGPVRQAAEHAPEKLAKASATLPGVASTGPHGFALADLSIGPGDVAVAALILGVVLAHGLDLRRNLIWMYVATLLGLGLVLATGWLIPGLVFLGLAGLLANRQSFTYTPRERRDLGIALVFVTILLIIGGLAWHSAVPGNSDDGNRTSTVRVQGD